MIMHNDKFVVKNSEIYGNGWVWPSNDKRVWKHLHHPHSVSSLETLIQLCDQKRTVVQAGGNCGINPKYFSRYFKTVYTFEPDSTNFYCLSNNVMDHNVYKFQAALGEDTTSVFLEEVKGNIGGYKVMGDGDIPQIVLDSLCIKDVDLMQIDVEGFEGYVINGAIQTITKYKPVIMLETKSTNAEHSIWSKSKLDELMESIGYVIHSESSRLDTIYIPGKQ